MPADLPSWLQAFAAIVALGIAVWSTLRTDRVATRRERLQARCIAMAIYPDILELRVSTERTRDAVKSLILAANTVAGQSLSAAILGAQIEIPSMLTRNVDNLYLLQEPAGPTCLQLVSVVVQFNSLMQSIAAKIVVMTRGEGVPLFNALDGHLELIDILVDSAKAEVAYVHDRKSTLGLRCSFPS